MVSKSTLEIIKRVPEKSVIVFLLNFQTQIEPLYVNLANIYVPVSSTTFRTFTKQLSSEVAENVSKQASRKLLIAVVAIPVIIDVIEIYSIWQKDHPEAIKQVQAAIKELEEHIR